MKIKRQYIILLLVLVIAIIALIIGILVTQNDDDDNGTTTENLNPVEEGQEGNSNPAIEEHPDVILIVVDDFTAQLGHLAEQIDDPEKRFADAANRIRELGKVSQDERYDYTEEISAIFTQLDEEFSQQATEVLSGRISANPDEENCALNTEGAAVFAGGGTAVFAGGGTAVFAGGGTGLDQFAHGVRVMAMLNDLDSNYGKNVTIRFETIDTEGFRMDTLADKLVKKVIEVRSAYPDRPIVINMSFGIIPCRGVTSLAIYEKLMTQYDPDIAEDADWLREIFRTMVSTGMLGQQPLGDPSFNGVFCEMYPEAKEVGMCDDEPDAPIIFVGAAGNGAYVTSTGDPLGDPFPYYPAAWGEVIAISGNEDDADFITEPPKAVWSNDGTILMPGRWQWVNKELGVDRTELGTSFAAPRYSYMIALYLAESNVNVGCPNTTDIPAPATPHDWATNPPTDPNKPPC